MIPVWKIISGITTGAMLVFLSLWLIGGCQHKKQVADLSTRLEACEHAQPKVETKVVRHDSLVYIDRIKREFVHTTDTVYVNGKMQVVNSYPDTLHTEDFDLFYKVRTIGIMKDISFPYYKLHTKEIITTLTKTIDTCISKPAAYLPKNHFALYGGISANNLHEFPLLNAGIMWTIKDKWGLMPGAVYDPLQSRLYGSVNIIVYIK